MAIMVFEDEKMGPEPQKPRPISKHTKDLLFAMGGESSPYNFSVCELICQLLGPVQGLLFGFIKENGKYVNEGLERIPSPFNGWTFIRLSNWAARLGMTVEDLQKELLNMRDKGVLALKQEPLDAGVWYAKTDDQKLYEMFDNVLIYGPA